MPSWTIRVAHHPDLERLTELLGELFALEADFQVDRDRQRQGLALMLAAPQACVLVAEAAGVVVGMATGQLTISTAEGGLALLVEDVVVEAAWRGQGIGRRLLDGLGDWADAHGAHRMQLLADRNNETGVDFYRKLGWQVTALICLRSIRPESSSGQ